MTPWNGRPARARRLDRKVPGGSPEIQWPIILHVSPCQPQALKRHNKSLGSPSENVLIGAKNRERLNKHHQGTAPIESAQPPEQRYRGQKLQ